MSRTGDLLLLQELDARHDRDSARLAAAEASIEGDAELDRLRRDARRAQRARAGVDVEVAAQEAVVEVLQRRVRDLHRHLYDGSVGNPQELIGMQHELDTLRTRLAEEEGEELEIMERAEAAAAGEQEALAAVAGRASARAAGAAGVAAEAVQLRAALEQHVVDRSALVEGFAAADLALYDRVRARLRPPVVRLSGDSCGGCHMPLGNSEIRRVRNGDAIVQCATCDRIVVS